MEEGATRKGRSIQVDGFEHVAPVPTAARVGPLIASSAIGGQQVGSAQSSDLSTQVDRVFDGVRRAVAGAGCTADDIVQMTFTVGERSAKRLIDVRWCEMFPDEDERPARHVVVGSLPEGLLVQVQFLAYRSNT